MILLVLIFITISLGFTAEIEIDIDGQIINHPNRFWPAFIQYKHWFYNTPRIIIWLCCGPYFFEHYKFWPAVLLSINTFTLSAFLFRAWHDSLYQYYILLNYKRGIGFTANSATPIEKENSFWDKIITDTWRNRQRCFYIFCALTLIQTILQNYL